MGRRLVAAATVAALAGLAACAGLDRRSSEPGPQPSSGPLAATEQAQMFGSFTSSAGLTSRAHWLPSGGDAGLVVYLDGDGQFGFDNPDDPYALGGPQGIARVAKDRGLDLLAVRTPAADGTWWTACEGNAAYLNDLLASRRYDRSKVWLVGFSGGAQFITQCFLPQQPGLVTGGGAVLFGGGGTPDDIEATPSTDGLAGLADSFPMTWITGDRDIAATSDEGYDGLDEARRGEAHYRKLGFQTRTEWPDGLDHVGITGRFGGYLATVLDEHLDDATPR